MNNIIIIGGGHNGLVCAAYLARAGKKVTVLEAADQVGGAAATREFAPGFRASTAHLSYLLDDQIAKDLKLGGHGPGLAKEALDTIALGEDGRHLTLRADGVSGQGLSQEDQAAYLEYRRMMGRFADVIGSLHNQVPPRITENRGDLMKLARLALKIRMLGREDMREFLRLAGINIYDVLQEYFENPLLKGALSMDAVLGTFSGPRSNNSVFTALHRMSGNNGGSHGQVSILAGGMGAITDAMAEAARKAGVEIRTGARVARISLDGMRVSGVDLENGEHVAADVVVSNTDIRSTIEDLLGYRHVEATFARRVSHVRSQGNTAKLHLALKGLPSFTGLDAQQSGQRLVIAPSLEYVELAFNHCKYGEHSAKPVFEITLPSLHDASLAPEGQHVLSAIVQYAPRELKGGWSEGKAAFTEVVLDTLSAYAPDLRQQISAVELLTPEDLEALHGNSGGHWHHAELCLDQFLMLRPVAHGAQYRIPVDGLFLCGAGCHPGGGVMGSAGRNAATAVLDKKQEAQ